MLANIDDFNRGCGIILGYLYTHFPAPVVLKPSELDDCLDLREEVFPEVLEARLRARLVVYDSTVQFLAEEGYITIGGAVGQPGAMAFARVRLTSRGLAALNRTPEALKPARKTLGETLAAAGKEILTAAARETLKQTVQAILGE